MIIVRRELVGEAVDNDVACVVKAGQGCEYIVWNSSDSMYLGAYVYYM